MKWISGQKCKFRFLSSPQKDSFILFVLKWKWIIVDAIQWIVVSVNTISVGTHWVSFSELNSLSKMISGNDRDHKRAGCTSVAFCGSQCLPYDKSLIRLRLSESNLLQVTVRDFVEISRIICGTNLTPDNSIPLTSTSKEICQAVNWQILNRRRRIDPAE